MFCQADEPVKRGQVKDLLVPELRLTTVLLWFIWSVPIISASLIYSIFVIVNIIAFAYFLLFNGRPNLVLLFLLQVATDIWDFLFSTSSKTPTKRTTMTLLLPWSSWRLSVIRVCVPICMPSSSEDIAHLLCQALIRLITLTLRRRCRLAVITMTPPGVHITFVLTVMSC